MNYTGKPFRTSLSTVHGNNNILTKLSTLPRITYHGRIYDTAGAYAGG
jgi:hypothetical protein